MISNQTVTMKVFTSILVVFAVIAVVRGQAAGGAAGGPPIISPGYLIGQEASKNAINFAINNALTTNADASTLTPEQQVRIEI